MEIIRTNFKEKKIQRIIEFTADFFNFNEEFYLGKSKIREAKLVRQVFHYYLYQNKILNLREIGRLCGQIHPTIIHSNKVIRDLLIVYDNEETQKIKQYINELNSYFDINQNVYDEKLEDVKIERDVWKSKYQELIRKLEYLIK
jgi:chromosomal replication initiation ATPase DnaA